MTILEAERDLLTFQVNHLRIESEFVPPQLDKKVLIIALMNNGVHYEI